MHTQGEQGVMTKAPIKKVVARRTSQLVTPSQPIQRRIDSLLGAQLIACSRTADGRNHA
jgi:hypothetical protein